MHEIVLTSSLDWRQIAAIGTGASLSLSEEAQRRISQGNELRQAIVARGERCYGVTTGVGAFSDTVVPTSKQRELSRNIILSHACGVGVLLGEAETRAIMAAAINNFAHGASGVRSIVVEYLLALLSANITPQVPRAGSLGYITHMAHIALVLIGEGKAQAAGCPLTGAEALRTIQREALVLEAKEGLSLINGTPCATGIAAIALERLQRVLEWSDVIAAMTFENIGTERSAFSQEAMAFRSSEAVARTASRLTALTQDSAILARRRGRTQDAMSLRALPQVHGAVRECLTVAENVVDRELNSSTDNPLLGGTVEAPLVFSQGHPIGTAMALALDSLAVSAAKVGAMSERRIDRLLNPMVSGLPAFLARDGGVSTGLMIAQYTALALVGENRRLGSPASLDGGVSSALQEDEIPYSTPAGLKLLKVVDNVQTILAIELISATQAYEFQGQARAPALERVYRKVREQLPAYADDRPLAHDIHVARGILRQSAP